MLDLAVHLWALCCQMAWDAFMKVEELTDFWKLVGKPIYWVLAAVERLGLARWEFMNLGYVALTEEDTAALEHSSALIQTKAPKDRLAIQLYERLLSVCPLFPNFEQTDMLEVGCGHAGGVRWANEAHTFKSNRGMDMNVANDLGGQVFQGNATAIPLSDNCLDMVINCESSHCYGDFAGYMREAMRVLRPGGYHVLTDPRPLGKEEEDLWKDAERAGFKLLRKIDITENVLAALHKLKNQLESNTADSLHNRLLVNPWIWTFLINQSNRFSNKPFKYHMACWQKPIE